MWALRQVPAPTAMMRYNWSTACERQIAGTMDHCTYSSVFIEDAERSISLNWQPLYDIDLFFAFLWFTKSLVLVLLLYIHLLTPVYTGLIGDFFWADDVQALSLPGTYHEKIECLGDSLNHFTRLKSLDLSRNFLESLAVSHWHLMTWFFMTP